MTDPTAPTGAVGERRRRREAERLEAERRAALAAQEAGGAPHPGDDGAPPVGAPSVGAPPVGSSSERPLSRRELRERAAAAAERPAAPSGPAPDARPAPEASPRPPVTVRPAPERSSGPSSPAPPAPEPSSGAPAADGRSRRGEAPAAPVSRRELRRATADPVARPPVQPPPHTGGIRRVTDRGEVGPVERPARALTPEARAEAIRAQAARAQAEREEAARRGAERAQAQRAQQRGAGPVAPEGQHPDLARGRAAQRPVADGVRPAPAPTDAGRRQMGAGPAGHPHVDQRPPSARPTAQQRDGTTWTSSGSNGLADPDLRRGQGAQRVPVPRDGVPGHGATPGHDTPPGHGAPAGHDAVGRPGTTTDRSGPGTARRAGSAPVQTRGPVAVSAPSAPAAPAAPGPTSTRTAASVPAATAPAAVSRTAVPRVGETFAVVTPTWSPTPDQVPAPRPVSEPSSAAEAPGVPAWPTLAGTAGVDRPPAATATPGEAGRRADDEDLDVLVDDDEHTHAPYTWMHLAVLVVVAFVLGILIWLVVREDVRGEPEAWGPTTDAVIAAVVPTTQGIT